MSDYSEMIEKIMTRFFSKVNKTNSCWIWTGAKSDGYGWFTISSYKNCSAHLFHWRMKNGQLSKGLELDHICRNRACVRLDHLEPVSKRENILRGNGQPAINARKTHCKWGHPFSPENTYFRKSSTGRKCLICIRKKAVEFRNSKKRG